MNPTIRRLRSSLVLLSTLIAACSLLASNASAQTSDEPAPPTASSDAAAQPPAAPPSAPTPAAPPRWQALPPAAAHVPPVWLASPGPRYAQAPPHYPQRRLNNPTALGFGIGLFATAASHLAVGMTVVDQDCTDVGVCWKTAGAALAIGGGAVMAGGLALMIYGGIAPTDQPSSELALGPIKLDIAVAPGGATLLGQF